jgi:Uma2 family endonuclease
MGQSEKYIPYYTYDDWVRWEGRWELIEGIPVAMSPMPVPEHQRVAAALKTELSLTLRKSGCRECRVYDSIDFKVSDDTIFEPDGLIVCGKITKKYLDFPPALIIEILSPSTMLKDRNTKFKFYQQEGVKYYLIVDVEKKSIEVYELINNLYQLQEYKRAFEFVLEQGCIIAPELDNVWE